MIRGISQAGAKKASPLFPAYRRPSRGLKPGVIGGWGGSSGASGNPSHGGAAPRLLTLPANCCCHAKGGCCCGREREPEPLLSARGRPPAGLRRRGSSATHLSPSPPCPTPPFPRPSEVSTRSGKVRHVGRPGPLPRLPLPTRRPPPAAPSGPSRGRPRPHPPPAGPRPGLPSPPHRCWAGAGPLAPPLRAWGSCGGGSPCWGYVCVRACPHG